MAEEFKQERSKKISPQDFMRQLEEREGGSPMDQVKETQQFVARETGRDFTESPIGQDPGIAMTGNIPQQFKEMIKNQQLPNLPGQQVDAIRRKSKDMSGVFQTNDELEKCLAKLKPLTEKYEEIELPSKGKFYTNIPGTIHIRPMTGAEEEILATQRHVRKGQAIDMIFANCIQENIPIDELLSIDRTYILIYLRGISYTEQYDVEIKCPECGSKFSTVINLDSDITLTRCPDDFNATDLQGILPVSGFKYTYRLATGKDDAEVTKYREMKSKHFADGEDDSLSYRTALLLTSIEEVTATRDLQFLLKKLPISDVSHLRNEINNPPFGVNTEIDIACSMCGYEFEIDLPLEASFFFPRKKEKTPQ